VETAAALSGLVIAAVLILAGSELRDVPRRSSVMVALGRSHRIWNSPPAKLAVERPAIMSQVQLPGVMGACRQSTRAMGAGRGAGCGAGRADCVGVGVGSTRRSAQDARVRLAGSARAIARLIFAFMFPLWDEV